MTVPIHADSLARISSLVRRRDLSPVEVTDAVLAQIDRVDGRLNAFITLTRDEARSAAREAEAEIAAGRWRGPLHGIPVSVKDLFHMRGVRTTAASRFFADLVSAEDSAVVERLRAAGAVLLGKVNLHEFAYGTTSQTSHFGPVRNPWDP
ncbi:MAG TPA: amidase, partial [Candidatus Binatia bacterium]|nr:amidase [Candidatus Binatia bacterium]